MFPFGDVIMRLAADPAADEDHDRTRNAFKLSARPGGENTERPHNVTITSSLHQNNVATSFWRIASVIITPCGLWSSVRDGSRYKQTNQPWAWTKFRKWIHLEMNSFAYHNKTIDSNCCESQEYSSKCRHAWLDMINLSLLVHIVRMIFRFSVMNGIKKGARIAKVDFQNVRRTVCWSCVL